MTERRLIVGRFDHEGLHQLQKLHCFVADEDLCGQNVLLLTSFLSLLRELLTIPREKIC